MKRIFFFGIMAAVIMVALASSLSHAQPYPAAGRVVLPNGDPVQGMMVGIWWDGVNHGYVYTNSNGVWNAGIPLCSLFVTASVGPPTKENTQKATAFIQCSGSTTFADIVLACGGPRQPPCPHQ
jgi:hypothetical protein